VAFLVRRSPSFDLLDLEEDCFPFHLLAVQSKLRLQSEPFQAPLVLVHQSFLEEEVAFLVHQSFLEEEVAFLVHQSFLEEEVAFLVHQSFLEEEVAFLVHQSFLEEEVVEQSWLAVVSPDL